MPTVLQSGGGPQPAGTPLAIDPVFQAPRVSIRPLDYTLGGLNGQVYGHYRAALAFVNTAAQAGPLVSLRWAPGSNTPFFVPLQISAQARVTTAFTTAQLVDLKATIGRAFSVSATGGTTVTLAGSNNQKNRATMGASLVTDLRFGNVTAGTRTLDGLPFGVALLSDLNAVLGATVTNAIPPMDLYKWDKLGQHPITLVNNEGIEIAANTALGAVGVVQYYVSIEWAEVAVF
jgi:hypothetical protein